MKSNTTAMNLKAARPHRRLLSLLLCLIFAGSSAHAQTPLAGPPAFIDYQGLVFDGTQTDRPLGSSTKAPYTADPTNYTMQFRLFANQSGGAPLWAEAQTVTVSLGAFSVRLGSGAPIQGEPGGSGSLPKAFHGSSERYLELTVLDQGQASGTPILPRLAFQSSPFAFVAGRAQVADSVEGGGTFSGTFSGTISAAGSTISGGSFNGGSFSGGSFSGNGSGLSSLNADTISSGTLNVNRLPTNVPRLDQKNSFTERNTFTKHSIFEGFSTFDDKIYFRNTDNVGVPTTDTTGGIGCRLVLYPGTFDQGPYAIGVAPGELWNASKTDFAWYVDTVEKMRLKENGRLGIGVSNPTKGFLQVNGYSGFTTPKSSRFMQRSGEVTSDSPDYIYTSIWASHAVVASKFAAVSDGRIKQRIGLSDSARDLATMRQIEITDYTFKDKISKGSRSQKKVIAQQVEEVYPQAVSKSTDVVPDIYGRAPITDGWVELVSDLKVGDRVKLIAETEEGIYEILEVAAGKFRTAFRPEGDSVFVYGREVNDFRMVDYEAIAMLNVSATQELARKLEAKDAEVAALQSENAVLKARLAALEANDKARAAKLAVIEKMLSAGQTNSNVVPVSATAGAR